MFETRLGNISRQWLTIGRKNGGGERRGRREEGKKEKGRERDWRGKKKSSFQGWVPGLISLPAKCLLPVWCFLLQSAEIVLLNKMCTGSHSPPNPSPRGFSLLTFPLTLLCTRALWFSPSKPDVPHLFCAEKQRYCSSELPRPWHVKEFQTITPKYEGFESLTQRNSFLWSQPFTLEAAPDLEQLWLASRSYSVLTRSKTHLSTLPYDPGIDQRANARPLRIRLFSIKMKRTRFY